MLIERGKLINEMILIIRDSIKCELYALIYNI
jgi:hypothetical protein